jgi:hypothetical protein
MKALVSSAVCAMAGCLIATGQLTHEGPSPYLQGCMAMTEAAKPTLPISCDGTATNTWIVCAALQTDESDGWYVLLQKRHASETLRLRLRVGESSNGVVVTKLSMTNKTFVVTIDSGR